MHSTTHHRLVVQERESRDEVVKAVKSRRHHVLAVMAKQFEDCKHGKTAVLKLVELALFKLLRGQVGDTRVESQVAVLLQKETRRQNKITLGRLMSMPHGYLPNYLRSRRLR